MRVVTDSIEIPKEIDFSERQLLVSKSGNTIVLTNGSHTEDNFCATVIQDKTANFNTGEYHTDFVKRQFIVYTGKVEMQN